MTAYFAFVLVVMLLLATCLAMSVWTRQERFVVQDVIDTQVGKPAPDLIDSTCSVNTGDAYYYLDSTDGLQRHPNIINACFFSNPANDTIMKPDMSDCARGSVVDDTSVVESIGVEPMQGLNKCVIRLRSDLSPALYANYEKKLLNVAVDRSTLYKTTQTTLQNIVALITRLQQQRDAAVAAMEAQRTIEQQTLTSISQLTAKISTSNANQSTRNNQYQSMQNILNNVVADKNKYVGMYNDSSTAFDNDNAALGELNIKLAATRANINTINSTITQLDNEISRLNGIISTNTGAANRLQACKNNSSPTPPDGRCSRACPGWYDPNRGRGYDEFLYWTGAMRSDGACECKGSHSIGGMQPDICDRPGAC